MNDDDQAAIALIARVAALILAACVLFRGEPDIVDAIRHYLLNCSHLEIEP